MPLAMSYPWKAMVENGTKCLACMLVTFISEIENSFAKKFVKLKEDLDWLVFTIFFAFRDMCKIFC